MEHYEKEKMWMQVQKEEYTEFKDLIESMSGSASAIIEELEIIDSIIDIIERAKPKKPVHIDKNSTFDGNWVKCCPKCGKILTERETNEVMSVPRIYHNHKYCDCGQLIDWE